MFGIKRKRIVEITANLARRLIAGREAVARYLRKHARQHTLLDLVGQLQLAFHALLAHERPLGGFQLGDVGAQSRDQRRTLDRDGRTVGECAQQRDLAWREARLARGMDDHQANLCALSE